MTKGKMVLELLIYAKSAIKNFQPIRSLFWKSLDHKKIIADLAQVCLTLG